MTSKRRTPNMQYQYLTLLYPCVKFFLKFSNNCREQIEGEEGLQKCSFFITYCFNDFIFSGMQTDSFGNLARKTGVGGIKSETRPQLKMFNLEGLWTVNKVVGSLIPKGEGLSAVVWMGQRQPQRSIQHIKPQHPTMPRMGLKDRRGGQWRLSQLEQIRLDQT